MNFGAALECAKDGVKIARLGWNGKGMHIQFLKALDLDRCNVSILVLHAGGGRIVPWCPSQTDVLAEDWVLITEIPDDLKFAMDHPDTWVDPLPDNFST